jgi:hypothetical protein
MITCCCIVLYIINNNNCLHSKTCDLLDVCMLLHKINLKTLSYRITEFYYLDNKVNCIFASFHALYFIDFRDYGINTYSQANITVRSFVLCTLPNLLGHQFNALVAVTLNKDMTLEHISLM